MKTSLLILLVGTLLTWNLQAQTKKIALHSHSGTNASFTMATPDEFGMYNPDWDRQNRERELKKERKKHLKKVKPLSPIKVDSLSNSCTMPDSLHDIPSIQPKKQPKNKGKKAPGKPYKTKSEPDTGSTMAATSKHHLQAVHFPKHQPATMEVQEPAPKRGALHWLVLMLTIPALLSFYSMFKTA